MYDVVDRIDDGTVPASAILAAALERYSAGRSMRGLPRLAGLAQGGWWAVATRPLAQGGTAHYLTWRWREKNRYRSHAVGRLGSDNEA